MFVNSINSLLKYGRNNSTRFSRTTYRYSVKTFSESPKQMLKMTTQTYVKHKKIIEDLLKVNDVTNFSYFAALMQSDMFHEFLFQALSN